MLADNCDVTILSSLSLSVLCPPSPPSPSPSSVPHSPLDPPEGAGEGTDSTLYYIIFILLLLLLYIIYYTVLRLLSTPRPPQGGIQGGSVDRLYSLLYPPPAPPKGGRLYAPPCMFKSLVKAFCTVFSIVCVLNINDKNSFLRIFKIFRLHIFLTYMMKFIITNFRDFLLHIF